MAKENQKTQESTNENKPVSTDPNIWKRDRVIGASLSGASFIAIIQLISLPQLSTFLKIALYSFAIAIPLLIAFIFITEYKILLKWTTKNLEIKSLIIFIIGSILALSGFTTIFCHFSFIVGSLFLASSIVGMVTVKRFTKRLEKILIEVEKQEEGKIEAQR